MHFVSCRQTMSGCRADNHAAMLSNLCLMELTFQVAMRMETRADSEAVRGHSPCPTWTSRSKTECAVQPRCSIVVAAQKCEMRSFLRYATIDRKVPERIVIAGAKGSRGSTGRAV